MGAGFFPAPALLRPDVSGTRDIYTSSLLGSDGMLYFASEGDVLYGVHAADGAISAFSVDSAGLAASSPWPRLRADARNSGRTAD